MVANETNGNSSLKTSSKGLKRRGGLSKYYSSKSQSFSSLELALAFENASSLGKLPSNACTTSCESPTNRQDSEELNSLFGRQSSPSISSDHSTSDLGCCSSVDAMTEDVSEFLLALQIDKKTPTVQPMARYQFSRWHPSSLRGYSVGRLPSPQVSSSSLTAVTEISYGAADGLLKMA